MDAPLRLKLVDGAAHLAARELLDDGPEGRIPLAHNRVEPGRFHSSLLQLVERTAGVHALMLAHVADEQHAVAGPEAVEEGVQLLRAGETRFIQHIEAFVVDAWFVSSCQMPLQRAGWDAGLSQQ